ncbi:MAG: type IV pilin protein [Pseudomonadota bacterium]
MANALPKRIQGRRPSGFTLIEVMVVVAIVAILAMVALPTYATYIKKSRARSAATDLISLSLNLENGFQKTLNYPVATTATTADTQTAMPGWTPTQSAYFVYTLTSTASPSAYTLTATGLDDMACTLVLQSDNTRTATGNACGFAAW